MTKRQLITELYKLDKKRGSKYAAAQLRNSDVYPISEMPPNMVDYELETDTLEAADAVLATLCEFVSDSYGEVAYADPPKRRGRKWVINLTSLTPEMPNEPKN